MAKIQIFWVVSLNIASYFLAKLIEKIITESPKLEQIFSQYVDINFYYMIFVTILNIGILYFILRKNRRVSTKIIDQQKESITAQENNIKLLKDHLSIATKKNDELEDLSKKAIVEEVEEKPDEVAVLKFPNVTWLTTKDVMKEHGLSVNKLKQHIENGLPGYIKNHENQELRPITERDLIALEVWSDESYSMVELWRFKTEDVEKYIKKVVWLTGKEVIDKYGIGAIELYQHIKNTLNIYPKAFSTVMPTDHAQPLSKYDMVFEIEYDMAHSDEVYNILKDYHFKVCDIEKYIRANKST